MEAGRATRLIAWIIGIFHAGMKADILGVTPRIGGLIRVRLHGSNAVTETEFSPATPLERALLDAQQGTGSPAAFFGELLSSQVFVLLDKEIGPEGRWDPSINLCVLTNAAGGPVVAAFTVPERSTPWHERLPQFGYGLLVSFTWLLQGMGSEVGVVINPGHSVGVELAPEAIVRLKQQVAGNSAAT